ncbi:MAG TPA: ATP-binding cassette domain-containing protein [Trebonia sp.]|nr:ATP-binding cassette domain-containing protein [Trebonia sp.]
MLVLDGIKKSFSGTAALQGIDVEIADKEFFCIVGPSGCGKSTLLRLVAGLDQPDEGSVLIDGIDVSGWEPVERGIGMVFQNYALFPHLTAAANIGFGLKGHVPKKELDRRVAEIAELLELDDAMLKRRPRQLSGGQRQRIALGRALIRRPKVLLMDEPLSGADALLRERMRVELRRFHNRAGTTTLYVTHDQREAMSMSDRLMVLDHGLVQQIGRPTEIYRRPETEFAARFIGSPGMSVWPVRLSSGDDGAALLSDDGEAWPLGLTVPAGTDRVLMGIRPERVALARRSPGDIRLRCGIATVEPQGEHTLVHARYGEAEIVATIATDAADRLTSQADDVVELWLSPGDLYLFHAETGRRIPVTDGQPAGASAADGCVSESVGTRAQQ